MSENLVIVESPAKAKTIEKFLGKGYTVKSSFGHIRDLSKKKLGIDIENGFEPDYEISADKKKVVSELKALAGKASTVWLASDEDREGEAISWHLFQTLGLSAGNTKRIAFHEITKHAILEAIDNPREIDMNLVNAQQARRVLDRLVGFELSPVLWKKVAPKLSAGRVQSVALKLIVEREREILDFRTEPYFKASGVFHPVKEKASVKLNASSEGRFPDEVSAVSFLEKCKDAHFSLEGCDTREMEKSPAPPFTTSLLQQEASRKLGFSVSQTMMIAQRLYESGLITYMRTDSTNLSSLAINTIKELIISSWGAEYSRPRQFKTKSLGAQEAHEAIRPTYVANTTINGTAQEKKLYELIWKRAVASQMSNARVEKTTLTIGAPEIEEKFTSSGEQILFPGFLKVYLESTDDDNAAQDENQILPAMNIGDSLNAVKIAVAQKYTQKPQRYSEASLVKKMEELGIGRPSTYAPTITTITQRGYIKRESRPALQRDIVVFTLKAGNISREESKENYGAEKNKLFPQDIGMLVTDYLENNFKDILDYGFTASVEEDFDKVACGKLVWNKMIAAFYKGFHKEVENSITETERAHSERVLGADPASGKPIIARLGKFGPLVQKGANDDPEKQFASLASGQLIGSITLEEALKLFELPRNLGEYNEVKVSVSNGRFGPYIKYGSSFVSVPKGMSPYTITLQQAVEAIVNHKTREERKHIKEFPEIGVEILDGRFGPYIKYSGAAIDGKDYAAGNYKIEKGTDASAMSLEDCKRIVSSSTPSGKSGFRAAKAAKAAKSSGTGKTRK